MLAVWHLPTLPMFPQALGFHRLPVVAHLLVLGRMPLPRNQHLHLTAADGALRRRMLLVDVRVRVYRLFDSWHAVRAAEHRSEVALSLHRPAVVVTERSHAGSIYHLLLLILALSRERLTLFGELLGRHVLVRWRLQVHQLLGKDGALGKLAQLFDRSLQWTVERQVSLLGAPAIQTQSINTVTRQPRANLLKWRLVLHRAADQL